MLVTYERLIWEEALLKITPASVENPAPKITYAVTKRILGVVLIMLHWLNNSGCREYYM